MSRGSAETGTALDLLEREDIELRSVFGQVRAAQGASVEERAEYGDLAKTVIRRVATREAALVDVANVAGNIPELEDVAGRIEQQSSIRRQALDKVEKMSRGVQGINLNTGQDFGKEFSTLIQIVGSEIEWDLDEAIPAVRSALEQHDKMDDLTSAEKVAKRAPTNLSPKGSRWYERAPIISGLISTYDRMRDFPQAVRQR
jgi:hypothetical protein